MGFELFFATGTSQELLRTTFGPWDWQTNAINCLVTFPFIKTWDEAQKTLGEQRNELNYRFPVKKTILDSGAFSAWNSGKVINFDDLCAEAGNGRWDEAVALDVIGDAWASLENARRMKNRGLHVMPVFHFGEPWEVLQVYKEEFDRIGLSCRFGESLKDSQRWLEQCFTRAYPAKFHSFGWVQEKALMLLPFTTADTASWHTGIRFGKGQAMPGIRIPKRTEAGPQVYDLRADVHHYLRLEERIQRRWETELKRFEKPLQQTSLELQHLEEESLPLNS